MNNFTNTIKKYIRKKNKYIYIYIYICVNRIFLDFYQVIRQIKTKMLLYFV
jgi:hypothetical protein